MAEAHPGQVRLDADEVYRVNRVRVAQYYGIEPARVDAMPLTDVEDTLAVLYADSEIMKLRAARRGR